MAGDQVLDDDIDQIAIVVVLPLVALAALPFVLAWLEESLEARPWRPPE